VVTKADLGDAAMRSRRDLAQALRSLGTRDVPVLAVSSLAPPTGIAELAQALDEHRASLDLPVARAQARRQAALREYTAEHGDAALRALGGRRAAEAFLASEDPSRGVSELLERLAEA
jgi:LAO/AO transport system kinase